MRASATLCCKKTHKSMYTDADLKHTIQQRKSHLKVETTWAKVFICRGEVRENYVYRRCRRRAHKPVLN